MVYSSVRRKHVGTAKSNVFFYRKLEHFHFKVEKERNRKGDAWHIQRKGNSLGLYCSNNTQMKKYKMFHRTFPGYTNIKRHSNVMLRDHRRMSSRTSPADADAPTKLPNRVSVTSAANPSGALVPKQWQVKQLLTAQSTNTHHSALLVVMSRNPLSYCLLGL